MIERDDHGGSHRTYPNYRHQLHRKIRKTMENQHYIEFRGTIHNHPSGDPTPSQADIQMTQRIVEIAGTLGISVHDHIIVGKKGHASLKGLRLM